MSNGELRAKCWRLVEAMEEIRRNRDAWKEYGRACKQGWDGNDGRFRRIKGREPAARVQWEIEMEGSLYPRNGEGWDSDGR